MGFEKLQALRYLLWVTSGYRLSISWYDLLWNSHQRVRLVSILSWMAVSWQFGDYSDQALDFHLTHTKQRGAKLQHLNRGGAPRCEQTGHPRRRRMKAEPGNPDRNLSWIRMTFIPDASIGVFFKNQEKNPSRRCLPQWWIASEAWRSHTHGYQRGMADLLGSKWVWIRGRKFTENMACNRQGLQNPLSTNLF